MTNPFQAEMAYLIRREKEIEERLQALSKEFGTWKERVGLAERAGKHELADAAAERLDALRGEATELREELRLLVEKKRLVRRESRRPTGNEVARAEALLESFQTSGLLSEEDRLKAEIEGLSRSPGPASPDSDDDPPA